MTYVNDRFAQPWRRRLVLALAISLGLAVASMRTAPPVDGVTVISLAEAADAAAPTPSAPPAAPVTPKAPKAKAAPNADEPDAEADTADSPNAESTITIGPKGVGILKNGKRVTVRGLGMDREYDSFEDFINNAPALAAFVFLIVLTIFLMPLLIVALLVWYKIRKTRLQNETLIKLAEKGVVPPAEAMQSLAPGQPPAGVPPSAVPLYEQARQVRKRAAWSDLRKGIVIGAVGLGLTFFSMLDDGTPNSIGLICLFVGIGYCLLWYFEDRPAQRDAGPPPAGSA
jgi:hypothetical protein